MSRLSWTSFLLPDSIMGRARGSYDSQEYSSSISDTYRNHREHRYRGTRYRPTMKHNSSRPYDERQHYRDDRDESRSRRRRRRSENRYRQQQQLQQQGGRVLKRQRRETQTSYQPHRGSNKRHRSDHNHHRPRRHRSSSASGVSYRSSITSGRYSRSRSRSGSSYSSRVCFSFYLFLNVLPIIARLCLSVCVFLLVIAHMFLTLDF